MKLSKHEALVNAVTHTNHNSYPHLSHKELHFFGILTFQKGKTQRQPIQVLLTKNLIIPLQQNSSRHSFNFVHLQYFCLSPKPLTTQQSFKLPLFAWVTKYPIHETTVVLEFKISKLRRNEERIQFFHFQVPILMFGYLL